MSDSADAFQAIIYAKVGMLETLVRLLVRNECLRYPEPERRLDNLYRAYRAKLEANAAQMPNDINSETAQTIALETLDMFFDQLRLDLREPDPNERHS